MLKTWTGQTELKAEGEGLFAARIATLDVIDKDNDVTVKGAFADAPTVRVSRFNHSSAIRDALPVGVATIREDGDAVIETPLKFGLAGDGAANLGAVVVVALSRVDAAVLVRGLGFLDVEFASNLVGVSRLVGKLAGQDLFPRDVLHQLGSDLAEVGSPEADAVPVR